MSKATNITDKEAANLLHQTTTKFEIANKFVERTILYPVEIEYTPGIKTPEIRAFVHAGSYCSEQQWQLALVYEKEFPELQSEYRKYLKEKGIPLTAKEVREKVTPVDLTR